MSVMDIKPSGNSTQRAIINVLNANSREMYEGRVPQNEADIRTTNATVSANQIETDEMMLDHEERIILLEVGE